MASKKILVTADLQLFRPVIWYGEPVYTRYVQLYSVLLNGLGVNYAELLAEPLINKNSGDGKGRWLSSYIENGKPLGELRETEQIQASNSLKIMLDKVKNFAQDLINSADSQQKELGELLLLSIEVPSVNNVYADGNKTVLTLWGFTGEETLKTNFKLAAALENTAAQSSVPENIQEEAQPIENKVAPPNNTSKEFQTKSSAPVPPPPVPPVPPRPTIPTKKPKENKGMSGKAWFLLGMLFMGIIALLIWLFFFRNEKDNYLPDNQGKIPPIDTTGVIEDPDNGNRKIFNDKVNIALAKGTDPEAFAKTLYETYADDLKIVYCDTAIKLLQVETEKGKWKEWIDILKKMPQVKLAFSNALFESSTIDNSGDPGFTEEKKSFFFDQVQAYQAWEITQGSENVIVAVIDNGFDLNHEELKGKVVNPYNVVEGNSNVTVCGGEGNEHGTHVAGTAVGIKNNNIGVCGIAPGCKLMPIQVADKDGNMQTLGIVAGILYALHHGASVANLSLGAAFGEETTRLSESQQEELIKNAGTDEQVFWDELYDFTLDENMVLVVAAGNENILAGIDPFSRSKKILVVSAYESKDSPKAEFSNYGEYSAVCAPGVDIYSSIPDKKFGYLSGTSMASPRVTGAVALIKSAHPDMKASEIVNALINTGVEQQSERHIGPLIKIFDAMNYNQDSILTIPEDAHDLSFAEGNWQSTTDLHSTISNKKIELFFEINKNGKGSVTFKEAGGDNCKAPTEITFTDGKLIINQTEDAKCQTEGNSYKRYKYECVNSENGADCNATAIDSHEELISFKMKLID